MAADIGFLGAYSRLALPLVLEPALPFERIAMALSMRPSSSASSLRLLFNVDITLSIGVASLEILPAATGVAKASYRKSRFRELDFATVGSPPRWRALVANSLCRGAGEAHN